MSKRKGLIYIAIAAISWGIYPTFNRLLYARGITVMTATAARAVVGGIAFLVWGISSKVFKGIKLKDYAFFLFYGCAAILSTYYFYSRSIQLLSGSMASMLLYTAPAFVIILDRVFFGEKITVLKLIALIMTFFGCVFVVRAYDLDSLTVNTEGIIYGLLSGLSYSLLTVIGKYSLKHYSGTANIVIPAIGVAIICSFIVPPWTIKIGSYYTFTCFLALGMFGTVVPYYFYLKGLAITSDGGLSIIIANIEPLVATLCGVIRFGDTLVAPQVFGIVLTLSGALLPVIKNDKGKT